MALLEDVADKLAKEVLALILKTGDDTIEKRVAEEIGASSPTLQENFSTALRIRKAEARATGLIKRLERDAANPSNRRSSEPRPESKTETPKKPQEETAESKAPAEVEFSDVISLPAPDKADSSR